MKILKPKTLSETLQILNDHGPEAQVLAGGTDLVPQINMRRLKPKLLVSIRGISELSYIRENGDGLSLGPLTSHAQLAQAARVREKMPCLANASAQLGSPLIRSIGTVGGNLCSASPAADTAPPLLSLGAEIIWQDSTTEHRTPLELFFKDVNRTSLPSNALLTGILIPAKHPETNSVFLKLGLRNALAISVVSVAVCASFDTDRRVKHIRISLGSVAPVPLLAKAAGEYLTGKKIETKTISEAAKIAADEASPISDVRASAWYRKEMAALYTKRALLAVTGLTEM